MTDCIFCKIVKGEIPSYKVYEDDKALAFLDIGPVNKGHTLIIPKEHHETVLDMPDELLAHISIITKKIAKGVMQGMEVKGFNIVQNNFKVSGQIIPHYHIHIIPRLEDDGLKTWPQGEYKENEAEEIVKKIKNSI